MALVETLGHKVAATYEQQIAPRIRWSPSAVGYEHSFLGVQRAAINLGCSGAGVAVPDDKHKVPSVRQEARPAVGIFTLVWIELRHFLYRSSRSQHAINPARWRGREQNHSISIPCASSRKRGVGQDLQPSAGRFNPFQFSVREKPYGLAVGRPEWLGGSLGPSQGLRGRGIER